MAKRATWFTGATALFVVAMVQVACSNSNGDVGGGKTIAHTRQAQTVAFTLPVPVGFSPQDIVIGATGVVNVNDFGSVNAVSHVHSLWGNIAAFGATNTLSILGKNSAVGVVWSRPRLFLRDGYVEYYKTLLTPDVQLGQDYGQPDENRVLPNLRQEPIWTVSEFIPEIQNPVEIIVNSGQTRSVSPGNHWRVVVNGGTLVLSGSGQYWFVNGLVLNSGSTVNFIGTTAPRIFVNNELILRATLSRPGLIFGYFGSNAVHVERPFFGDLFLAPSADVEIKANSFAHFFGRNVTLFEGIRVDGPLLSQATQDYLRPVDGLTAPSVAPRGLFSTESSAVEIASALLTPQLNSACTAPRAFLSFWGAHVMHKPVSAIGTTQAATILRPEEPPSFPPPTPAPSDCLTTWLAPFTPAWPIQPGGTPYYADPGVGTDSLMTRISGGRVVHAGFSRRWCDDPSAGISQPSDCPTGQPTGDTGCNPDPLENLACVYGSNQCQCLSTTGCGLEGAACIDDKACCSGACSGEVFPNFSGTCTAPATTPPTSWVCGTLTRVDAGVMGVRMSTNCGTGWTAGAFDPSALGIRTADNFLVRGVDRPEMFWDNFDNRLYLNANGYPSGSNSPLAHNYIYSASTSGVTNASNFNWQPVQPQLVPGDDDVPGPRVMTTVLDDRARLNTNPPSFGRYVHLVTARCFEGRPEVQIYTPFGRKTWNLFEGDTDPSTICTNAEAPVNGMPFTQLKFGPSIVGVSSVPPRVRVAYTGAADLGAPSQRSMINVYSVTLRSANNYATRPVIVREHRVEPPVGIHAIWPQLIAVDGLASSDRSVDSPTVLRWTEVAGNTIGEEAQVLYSGLVGPVTTIAQWSMSATFPGKNCLNDPFCFNGDYKYGAFYLKSGGVLRFFTPWTGGGTDPATNMPIAYHAASGAFLDVTP